MKVKAKAADLFDKGFSEVAVGGQLGIPVDTVKRWLYAYRALGKEALFVTEHKTYSQQTKVKVAQAVLAGEMSKPEAMVAFGIRSKTQVSDWCRLYREGGADALAPKPKGRPRKHPRTFATREEELEARIQELELENEILKRIGALADEIEQRRQTR